MVTKYIKGLLQLLVLGFAAIPIVEASEQVNLTNEIVSDDIVSMDRVNSNEFFVGGYRGFFGIITINDEVAVFSKIKAPLAMDIEVVKALSSTKAVIGTSKGDIYQYADGKLSYIKTLSEHNEPILDMAVRGQEVWAVGPRGLIAYSSDEGGSWRLVPLGLVTKHVTLPSNSKGVWYLGAFNIEADSFVFNAKVNGKKAVDDEDYYLDANGGSIEIVNALDESSDLSISFKYSPGPQFQAGDVTLNTVTYVGNSILVAGEFGTVIKQGKDGVWNSVYEDINDKEINAPYWNASDSNGSNVALVGAGGVVSVSSDNGESWVPYNMKSDNGLFSVSISDDKKLMVAGAVGTIATHDKHKWVMVDRTTLHLVAWAKPIVTFNKNSKLVGGGRGTLLLYKNDTWSKLLIRSSNK